MSAYLLQNTTEGDITNIGPILVHFGTVVRTGIISMSKGRERLARQ